MMRYHRKQRNHETEHHPSDFFLLSHFLHIFTGRGVGEKSLPLSLGIVATDISLDDNEGIR